MVNIPNVWDLVDRFKNRCRLRGWWTPDFEDVIYAEGVYHNFVPARKVHIKTFRSVIANCRCFIRHGLSYKAVDISYMAWVFSKHPSEDIVLAIAKNPRLLKRIALFDLADAYVGKPICLKINETKSIVFREFERFLKTGYNLTLIDRLPPLPPERVSSQLLPT